MNEIEIIGVFVGLSVITIETFMLMQMRHHVAKLEQLTRKLDSHITHMDKHIDLMDERVIKIKNDIALVCSQVGVKPKK